MSENEQTPHPPSRALRVVQALTLIVIILASVAAVYLRDHIHDLAGYGYTAVFLVGLISNATIILPVPGLAVSSLLGSVFNPWLVGVVGGLGQALGELSGYMVGYSSQELVDRGAVYARISTWMRRHGMLTIFVLALVPNPIFDLGGIAAGALRFPAWKFWLSCSAGKIVKNIGFALAGWYGIENLMRLLQG